jgi:hypothetical protein
MLAVMPLPLIYKSFERESAYQDYFLQCLAQHPSSPEKPWHLVLYADEVVPGNQIGNSNERKIWVVYFSWLEFGMQALCKEESWACVFAGRSSEIAKLSAGISQVYRAVIKQFFGADGHDAESAGLLLDASNGTQYRLYFKLAVFLQDGAAQSGTFCCKNDSGLKLCMLCMNLYSEKSGLANEDGTEELTCSLVQASDLVFASDDDIRSAVVRLAGHHGEHDFENRQKAAGFRHEPHGLMLDRALDRIVLPATQFCHDWMHAIFVNGCFNTLVYLLFETLMAVGLRNIWTNASEYLLLHTWPKRVATSTEKLASCLDKKRIRSSRKAKHFKCTASEGLSLYPVLALYIQLVIVPMGYCKDACDAFIAFADMVDLLQASNRRGRAVVNDLRTTISMFLEHCVSAGWRARLHPKFHWIIHLPIQLMRFGCLPTCWVHERKHRMVKRYAQDVRNTRMYERSVMGEVTCQYLADLQNGNAFDFQTGLVRPRVAPKQLRDICESCLDLTLDSCLTSSIARISEFESCARGDVVLIRSCGGDPVLAGRLHAHVACDGEQCSILQPFRFLASSSVTGTAEWDERQALTLVPTADVLGAVVHSTAQANVIRTLLPLHLRQLF